MLQTALEIRGADLAVSASLDREDQPILVWHHGMFMSRATEDAGGLLGWARLAGRINEIRYDARGHGQSSGGTDPSEYEWDAFADDMVAVMDQLGVGRAFVGGASMGCAVALHVALREPERVAGLVLAIPPTAWEARAGQVGVYLDGATAVEANGSAALAEIAETRHRPFVFDGDFAGVYDAVLAYIRAADPVRTPAIMRGAAASDAPALEQVASFAMPALVLSWADDAGHPVSGADQLTNALPVARRFHASRDDEIRMWPSHVQAFTEAGG